MAAQPSQKPTCTKRGVILTCYVDGKKRFRAMQVEPDRPTAPPTLDGGATLTGRMTNVSLAVSPWINVL
ncbi:MAG: hypothetical protein H6819_11965 [Phycisphaerales bacterium]|nr:hypothetical protein [Phycisphaerales bacterium]MCB9858055.1 hypothetical protein [Phycisphaerales bacterium]MCB9864152.1 hypothetical protein [Phycisphaerales bacterium]